MVYEERLRECVAQEIWNGIKELSDPALNVMVESWGFRVCRDMTEICRVVVTFSEGEVAGDQENWNIKVAQIQIGRTVLEMVGAPQSVGIREAFVKIRLAVKQLILVYQPESSPVRLQQNLTV